MKYYLEETWMLLYSIFTGLRWFCKEILMDNWREILHFSSYLFLGYCVLVLLLVCV